MKTICITNQKGGSGKTTLAALISLTLAMDGRDVLCIDGDPQGGLTALLGADPGRGLYDALMGDDILPINVRGLRLLGADHRLDKIAYTLPPYEVQEVCGKYTAEYIVIDTPPTVQGISRAAATAADTIIIPADIAKTTIGPTLYTIDALAKIKKKGKVLLIGKEPKPENHGYTADLFTEFSNALKKDYGGTIPRTAGAQKAAAGLQKVPASIASIIRGLL